MRKYGVNTDIKWNVSGMAEPKSGRIAICVPPMHNPRREMDRLWGNHRCLTMSAKVPVDDDWTYIIESLSSKGKPAFSWVKQNHIIVDEDKAP